MQAFWEIGERRETPGNVGKRLEKTGNVGELLLIMR